MKKNVLYKVFLCVTFPSKFRNTISFHSFLEHVYSIYINLNLHMSWLLQLVTCSHFPYGTRMLSSNSDAAIKN